MRPGMQCGHSGLGKTFRYDVFVAIGRRASRRTPTQPGSYADAIARLGGHKIGHNTQTRQLDDRKDEPEVKQTGEEFWRARRDSNSRPIAPEAIALSS